MSRFPVPGGSIHALSSLAAMDTATIASTSSGKTVVTHDHEHSHDTEHDLRKERFVVDADVSELLHFELDPKPQGYYTRYPNEWSRIRCECYVIVYSLSSSAPGSTYESPRRKLWGPSSYASSASASIYKLD